LRIACLRHPFILLIDGLAEKPFGILFMYP
jgi:hypothetical protein